MAEQTPCHEDLIMIKEKTTIEMLQFSQITCSYTQDGYRSWEVKNKSKN